MEKLDFEQMESINGGKAKPISVGCGWSIGMTALAYAGLFFAGATTGGAAIAIVGLYGSIIGIGFSC
ncbi:MAG: class IIb bacteriocin, lactobin A/cerein 7B family [Paludibacter sp.]